MLRDDIETMAGQWLEATGQQLPASALARALDEIEARIDGDDGEWDQEGGPLDVVLTEALADLEAEGERVRRECQMTGSAKLGRVTVRPNAGFIAHSAPPETKELMLRGWPDSPHWYVELVDGDGEAHEYRGTEMRSWADVVVEAERLADELDAEDRARMDAWRRRVALSAASVRVAERALAEAQSARDAVIGEALAAGLPAIDVAREAGVARSRVYQIRDGK